MTADDRSPLAGTEVHMLSSARVGAEFKIFVGHCGDDDPDGPKPARGRGYPSLEIASTVLADEFHVTVPSLNLSRSLRHLFAAPT